MVKMTFIKAFRLKLTLMGAMQQTAVGTQRNAVSLPDISTRKLKIKNVKLKM